MSRHLTTAVALFLAFGSVAPAGAAAQTLRIYHIDVDQADATLLVAPSGQTLLVDSGKNGHGPRIMAVMRAAGVSRIDHFVATHYHEDHYGGIDDLVRAGIQVGTAYDRGDKDRLPSSKLKQDTHRDYEAAIGHRARHLHRGDPINLDPLMMVTCISSGGVVLSEPDEPAHGEEENDMSIGLLVKFGAFRYWVGGDVETSTEAKIAALGLVQDVDVYQTNHHGADNGSSGPFLTDLQPTVVVISNGSVGSFGHPRASTLERMRALLPEPTVIQLNKYLGGGNLGGNVPDSFIADLEAREADGTVLVTVDGGTGTYTVSYGGTTRNFVTKSRNTAGQVVISGLLPDPADGPDRLRERVTLRNTGSASVDLTEWILRDLKSRVWSLAALGTLEAGQTTAVRREGMAMSLDNGGDVVELLDPTGRVVDVVSYEASEPGIEIVTGH